jgi:pSer/pThr/pTyr-binding forkhead associated (FHA) protein
MHKLVISDDEGKTTVVPLVRDEITIGRKEGNTIRLTERNVSRRHARLKKANGAYLIEDLESYNGIKVNGRRVEKTLPLKLGDQVAIGDYMIALQDAASDAPSVADAATGALTPPSRTAPLADSPTAMIAAPVAPVAAAPPARLVMISPPAPGAEFAFQRPKMRLGRAEDLDICVNHRSISREHAEFVRSGDQIRLVDLGSANGTRVNGKDVTDVPLNRGDVIELGQVRFRYVGEGELYHFDAERTVQMDALVMPASGSKMPIFIGAGIVALALIVTIIFVAMSGGGPPDDAISATAVPTIAPNVPPVALPSAAADPNVAAYTTALAECQRALRDGQYDQALTQAEAALALRPGDADASQCQRSVTQAIDLQVAGDARGLVERARAALAGSPEETLRLTRDVLAMANAPADARTEAESLRAQATEAVRNAPRAAAVGPRPGGGAAAAVRPGGGAAAAVRPGGGALAVARPGGGAPPAGGGARPGGGGTTAPAGGGTRPGGGATTAPAGGGAGARPPVAPPPDTGGADRLERARALMLQGNNNGVIALLQGARSQQELELLIATYQNVGNTPAKLAAMQRYIDRFPTTPKARQYQQVLARQQ